MLELLKAIFTRARLYLWKRHQFENEPLRRHFRDNYDIDVGDYSYGCFDRWRMPGPMRVGRYCSIADTVRSAPGNHPMAAITTYPALYERQFGVVDEDVEWDFALVIEDDVWIGHNVMIVPSCRRIGRGAVVGAGAVVTKDVEPYAVVVGNPARKIRDRFTPDVVAALEESRWWDLDMADLARLVRDRRDMVYGPTADTLAAWTRERRTAAAR